MATVDYRVNTGWHSKDTCELRGILYTTSKFVTVIGLCPLYDKETGIYGSLDKIL